MKNDYEIRGEVTAIFLKRKDGTTLETLIDTSDLDKIQRHDGTWYSRWNEESQTFYAQFITPKRSKKRTTVLMHRLIADAPKGFQVDHINHNGLDNTRSNLRVVTASQNRQNLKGASRNSSSGILGVTWNKKDKRWHAYIAFNKQQIHLGSFLDKNEAAEASEKARAKYKPFSVESRRLGG